MVGRSIEISRETCPLSDVDGDVVKYGSEERCRVNVPGPSESDRLRTGSKSRSRRNRLKRRTGVRGSVVMLTSGNQTRNE